MKGDFSRDTFDRRHRFSRVLMQQGRVLLDADWNEQTSILLHTIRTLATDLIGPHGGPGDGFLIGCLDAEEQEHGCDFTIGWGHYYVDGILCENVPSARCPSGEAPAPMTYLTQPDHPAAVRIEDGDYLVYLDVWERHLTHLEVEHIREVALGGPDTATRARVVWQVKVVDESECGHQHDDADCASLLAALRRKVDGPRCMRARARVTQPPEDPCIVPPEARYRGAENQLYRVEIHAGGSAGNGASPATFKWSRDNGAIVFPIRSLQGDIVTLDTLGPDSRRTLREGDWVEFVDDDTALTGNAGLLARVDEVDRVRFQVMLAMPEGVAVPAINAARHPLLRRWDQGSDALPVQEGRWLDLEDGVQVFFEAGGAYRTGDYWLVPARTATGDVEWPVDARADGSSTPRPVAPHGSRHHYAPLARIAVRDGVMECDPEPHDCRCVFEPHCAAVAEHRHEDERDTIDPNRRAVVEAARREAIVNELRAIADVGRVRANVFIAEGLETPAAVARLSTSELRTMLGVSDAVAESIRESAVRIAGGRG